MKHSFAIEIREASRPGYEKTLTGTIIQEGRAASQRREVFAPGSVEWPSAGISILTEHRGAMEVRAQPVRHRSGRITVSARATDAIQAAVAAGRKFMSIEFKSIEERQAGGGAIREITRAMVDAAALVLRPEYTQTSAEIRSAAEDLVGDAPWL